MLYGQLFACPHCRAEYDMTATEITDRHKGSARCIKCRKTMYEWDGSRISHFRSVKSAKKPKA